MQRLHGPTGPFRSSTRRWVIVTLLAPDIAILHTRFWIKGEIMHDALSQEDRESVGTRVSMDGWADRRDAERDPPPRPAALGARRGLAPRSASPEPFPCTRALPLATEREAEGCRDDT